MQIVINIPENEYRHIKEIYEKNDIVESTYSYIYHGIPLPKGHGRLIDADYLRDVSLLHNYHGNTKHLVPYADRKGYRLRDKEVDETIINAPTVIEADKEESGNKYGK